MPFHEEAAAPCVDLFLIPTYFVGTREDKKNAGYTTWGNPARVPGFRLKALDFRRPTFYSFRTTCIICSPKPIV